MLKRAATTKEKPKETVITKEKNLRTKEKVILTKDELLKDFLVLEV